MPVNTVTNAEQPRAGFQRILRNVTNTVQPVAIPGGAVDLEITYQHTGSNAGNLLIVPEAYSLLDAQQRAGRDDAHIEVLDNQSVRLTFNPNTRPAYIYIRTASARSTDTTNVHIRSRAPATLTSLVTTLSPRLVAAWDGVQAAPDAQITDLSGNGHHATWDSGTLAPSSVWGTPGYATLTAGGTHYPESGQSAWAAAFNPAGGDILVVTGRMNAATPGSTDVFLSSGYSTTYKGFRFRVGTDKRLSVAVHYSAGQTFLGYTTDGFLADGTEHSFAAVLDFTQGIGTLYVDDAEQTGGVYQFPALSDAVSPRGWVLGAQPTGATLNATSTGTFTGKLRDLRMLVFPGGYSATTLRTLLTRLHTTPQYLPTTEDAP